MPVTITNAAGQNVTIEGLDSIKQPRWTEDELDTLYDTFKKEGPYKDGDYSQFFRLVQKALPHRTLASALDRIHDAQVNQLVPYFGALPRTDAKERDRVAMPYILECLAKWKQEQADNKKKVKNIPAGFGMSDETAGAVIELLLAQNKILADCHKFLAGIYRRVCGDDGKFVQVEILRQPMEIGMRDIAGIHVDGMVFAPSTEESDPYAEHITMVHTSTDGSMVSQRFDVLQAPVSDETDATGRVTPIRGERPAQGHTDGPRVPQGPPPSRPSDTFIP